jgi:glucose-1-phosphate adenylyltransferase
MNYYTMIDFHRDSKADLTVGVVELDKTQAPSLGVVEVDNQDRVVGFQEKSKNPKAIIAKPDKIYASMGIYVFNRSILVDELNEDAKKSGSTHDFGKDIIPRMVKQGFKITAFNFIDENKKEAKYWRDIGTIDAYYEANMDLVRLRPLFDLYDKDWPIRTHQEQFPPAKTVFTGVENTAQIGLVLDSLVAGGCIISGGKVERSILSPNVRINSYSEVYDSILMEGVNVGRHTKIKRAIIDKDVDIPEGVVIGYDAGEDKKRFSVSESGIVVVAKGTEIK